jgi:hypothetical protein
MILCGYGFGPDFGKNLVSVPVQAPAPDAENF